ncbi:MAG: hypothetical protein A3E81_01390 [Gammaproteobacteria bacterium RIFCSPHIGHO2_12_FULL_36_30]|nr:MAG: hypothetical protein A3E81_01390 [Gammaproteobacteria bacterium RIFCSPHIGHO2_12_FULL_36_30]
MNIKLNDIDIEIIQKNIKHVHLRVHQPFGHVKVSVPKKMTIENIRLFLISRFNWILRQKNKIDLQTRAPIKEYIDGEHHYFNGEKFLLTVIEKESMPCVIASHDKLLMQVRRGATKEKRQAILEKWYRLQLKEKIDALILIWEKKINVSVSHFTIKKMKTRWGSCSPKSRSIRLNLELIKKPFECLEYVLVHELIHLLEPSHNRRFVSLMDQFLPTWRFCKKKLIC